jgi:hypothetical protein
MWRIYGGVLLVVAGITALIEAHNNRPLRAELVVTSPGHPVLHVPLRPGGLSDTAYDLLRIGGWALAILGALLVIVGLIRYRQMQRRAA